MSKGDDRTSVFRTTKVRTAIKGDNSWIQRRRDSEPEEEEKPWMAEVRAGRENGAPKETSPVSSPTKTTPASTPASTDSPQRTKADGYLIRGVFKKTDTKPASSSTNGYSAPSNTFTKKPSEGYKKIAPHTVRSTVEPTVKSEPHLSPEEVEKRTEAASGVLKTSAARQRSYVLSAAKKYESAGKPESPPETTTTFVAKRVVISDDEEDTTPVKPVTPPPPPVPVRVSAPEPAPRPSVKEEAPPVPAARTVVTPKPRVVTPEPLVVIPEPEPQQRLPEPVEEQSPDTLNALSDTLISFNAEPTSPKEEQKATPVVDLVPSPVTARVSHTKPKWFEDTQTVETSVDPDPIPEPSDDLDNDDLFSLAKSGEEIEDSPPSTPQTWSDDLLSGPIDSFTQPKKPTGTLNLLADDIIPIDTSRTSLSSDDILSPTETKTITTKTTVTDGKGDDSKITTTTTVTTTVIEDSSDPFDPIPKVTSPIKSPVELFDPLVLDTKSSSTYPAPPSPDNSMPSDALVDLADDIIPFDTNTSTISKRNWAQTWDTSTPDAGSTAESEEQEEEEETADPVPIKSADNDSPWDRWSSTTVHTTKTEESHVDTEDQESTSSDPDSKKGIVFLKQYVDDNSDYQTSRSSPYDYRHSGDMTACTYCGELVGSDAKITIEHLNISCHPTCFKCGICSKPMGDLLFSMFLHNGMVHCETCYANVI